jgi:hypothetical protein
MMRGIGEPSRAAGLVVACALLSAGPASAQIWIGQVVGEMTAQAAQAAREKACLEGAPPDPKSVPKITEKVNGLMTAYFALDSKSGPAAVGKVFSLKSKGVSFHDAAGPASPTALGARLDEPTPTLALTSSVIAGDTMSARFIWTATPPDGAPAKVYAVDFTGNFDSFWGTTSWRIWHMAVLAPDKAPSAPGAYCHFDPDQAF